MRPSRAKRLWLVTERVPLGRREREIFQVQWIALARSAKGAIEAVCRDLITGFGNGTNPKWCVAVEWPNDAKRVSAYKVKPTSAELRAARRS